MGYIYQKKIVSKRNFFSDVFSKRLTLTTKCTIKNCATIATTATILAEHKHKVKWSNSEKCSNIFYT